LRFSYEKIDKTAEFSSSANPMEIRMGIIDPPGEDNLNEF